jgi:cytochrome c553
MKRAITHGLALGALLGAGVAAAAPSSNVAWTAETMQKVGGGNAEKGKSLTASCAGCHGAAGVSAAPVNPHLAGQDAAYTYKQLKDYKDRTRANALMSSLVAGLSDQDMADVAAFYAAQPLPPATTGSAGETPRLVSYGEGERLIPGCAQCHGARGEGNPGSKGMPALAGQTAEYFQQTMQAYRSGARANDVYGVMRSIAARLTDQEIAELAAYYAGLGAK